MTGLRSTLGAIDARIVVLLLASLLGALPWTGAASTALTFPPTGLLLPTFTFGRTLEPCYELALLPVQALAIIAPRALGLYYAGEGVLTVRAVWVTVFWDLVAVWLSIIVVRRARRRSTRGERALVFLAWALLLVPLDPQVFRLVPWGVADGVFAASAIFGRFLLIAALFETTRWLTPDESDR